MTLEEEGESAAHEGDPLLLPVVVGGPRVSHLAKALLLVVAECMREYGVCRWSARWERGGEGKGRARFETVGRYIQRTYGSLH